MSPHPTSWTYTVTPLAAGGMPVQGRVYIVGNKGPERFVPAAGFAEAAQRLADWRIGEDRSPLEQTLDLLVAASQDLAQALRDLHAASTEPVA